MAKGKWLIAAGAVLLAAAGISGLYFKPSMKKTVLLEETGTGNAYTLTVYMIGDPDFPFGAVACSAVLKEGETVIRSQDFSLHNDGKVPSAEDFRVTWASDGVILRAHAEESDDVVITLSYQ